MKTLEGTNLPLLVLVIVTHELWRLSRKTTKLLLLLPLLSRLLLLLVLLLLSSFGTTVLSFPLDFAKKKGDEKDPGKEKEAPLQRIRKLGPLTSL